MSERPDQQSAGQQGPDQQRLDQREHAGREFPAEAAWLDLPLPTPAELDVGSARAFAEQVLRAVREDATADRQLREIDRELPRELLAAFTAPAPTAGFVARTVAGLRHDRVTRWQHLLARYVAPDPSPQFVARTLAALRADQGSRSALGAVRGAVTAWGDRHGWGRLLSWPLLAAAALVVLWSALRSDGPPPFERRLADRASPALAHAYAPTPLATVLANRANAADPDSLDDGSADGIWLLLAEAR